MLKSHEQKVYRILKEKRNVKIIETQRFRVRRIEDTSLLRRISDWKSYRSRQRGRLKISWDQVVIYKTDKNTDSVK